MIQVSTLVFDPNAKAWRSPTAVTVPVGNESFLVGREGDLAIGIDPPDTGVSRQALRVTATSQGWTLDVLNSNHAWVHPWGQRPTWVEANSTIRKRWPRIGVLLVGKREDVQHWVLLESDHRPQEWQQQPMTGKVTTERREASAELTPAQLQAVTTMFAQHLAWPPVIAATPLLLASTARRLHISETAVTDRLKQARSRVHALGPQRQIGVTDPEYVYLLAAAGYLPVPPPFRPTDTPTA